MSHPLSPTLSPSSGYSTPRSQHRLGVVYSTKGEFDIRDHYFKLLSRDPTKSMPIAAIESLAALCDATRADTIHELISAIEEGADALKESIPNAISLTAGCNLFKRFIIAHAHDDPKDFEAFKKQLQENGHVFAQRAREAREMIATLAVKLISHGMTVFLHGHSRCVMGLCLQAAKLDVRFQAIVAEAGPSMLGLRTAKELRGAGVPVAVVNDTAMGYAMKKASIVLTGAEGVFGDGSILNILGSLQLAIVAKMHNKPFFVAAETHKFVDIFPLDQFSMPVEQEIVIFDPEGVEGPMPQNKTSFVDFVPRDYVSGFVTEVGRLTPQQVSDKVVAMRFD